VFADAAGCISAVEIHDRPSQQSAFGAGGLLKHKPKALDLFCCAGGAGKGIADAGFEVTGVDVRPQPRYPFRFIQGDALAQDLSGYDFVWASPPCQAHTTLNKLAGKDYECFIVRTREKLKAWGGPYIIENVVGAPLINPVTLCGSAFGIGVRRHRLFESNVWLWPIDCNHAAQPEPIDVTGTGGFCPDRVRTDGGGGNSRKPKNIAEARAAMGISWMTRPELSQAIPPAFSEYLARQVLKFLGHGFEECVFKFPKGEAPASEGRKYNSKFNERESA